MLCAPTLTKATSVIGVLRDGLVAYLTGATETRKADSSRSSMDTRRDVRNSATTTHALHHGRIVTSLPASSGVPGAPFLRLLTPLSVPKMHGKRRLL